MQCSFQAVIFWLCALGNRWYKLDLNNKAMCEKRKCKLEFYLIFIKWTNNSLAVDLRSFPWQNWQAADLKITECPEFLWDLIWSFIVLEFGADLRWRIRNKTCNKSMTSYLTLKLPFIVYSPWRCNTIHTVQGRTNTTEGTCARTASGPLFSWHTCKDT